MTNRRRTVKPADVRFDELLDAAERVIARKGFTQTRVEDITAAARTSVGTFYRFFRSRDEVVVVLLRRRLGRLEAGVISLSDRMLDEEWWSVTRAHNEELVDAWLTEPRLGRELLTAAPTDPLSSAPLIELVAGRIRAGMADGVAHADDPERVASLYVHGTLGLIRSELAAGTADRDAITTACWRLLRKALQP